MKIDISIPGPILAAATKLAQKLDMSLSKLYTGAVAAYIATYEILSRLCSSHYCGKMMDTPSLVKISALLSGNIYSSSKRTNRWLLKP